MIRPKDKFRDQSMIFLSQNFYLDEMNLIILPLQEDPTGLLNLSPAEDQLGSLITVLE